MKDSLQTLLPLLEIKEDTDFLDLQLEFYQEVKKNLQTYVDDPGKPNEINPEFVASVINELAANDAIFTVDTGMCNVWAARYIIDSHLSFCFPLISQIFADFLLLWIKTDMQQNV